MPTCSARWPSVRPEALRGRARIADGVDVLGELQDAVGGVLQTALRAGEAPATAALERLTRAFSDHHWRLRELCEHALDERGVQSLAERLTAAGLQTKIGTLSAGPAPDRPGTAQPAAPAALRDLAAQLSASGRDAETATAYEQLLMLQPQWPEGWYNLGQAQWRARHFEAALRSYQRALDNGIRMPEEAHLNRAVIKAASLNRPDAAQQELTHALTLNPRYIPAILNLGNLCEQRGDRDRARHWFARVLEVDPRHALALTRQAALRTFVDAQNPLIVQLGAALREPRRSNAERADLGFGLGKVLDDVGRYDEAFAAYAAANDASRRAGGPAGRDCATWPTPSRLASTS